MKGNFFGEWCGSWIWIRIWIWIRAMIRINLRLNPGPVPKTLFNTCIQRWQVCRGLGKRLATLQALKHFASQLLVQFCPLGFPGHHFIAYLPYYFARVAYHQAARGYDFAFFNKTKRPYNAFMAQNHPVHNHRIHANQAVAANFGTMDNGPMANMRPLVQVNGNAGKHVDGAVFLHIAAVPEYNGTPIATQRRPRAYITILANGYMTCNRSLWVHKRGRVHYGGKLPVLVKHGIQIDLAILGALSSSSPSSSHFLSLR